MAGNQTVKDLDKKARLIGAKFEYFPVWYFNHRRKSSQGESEEILIEPAAATSVTEIRHVKLPAGDLRKYDTALDAQSQPPTVPLQAAMTWLAERQIPKEEIKEQALVHVPIYTFKYTYKGNPFTALVEAGTGGVLANIYPAKAESPYLLIGGLTALIYLCLALIPLIGGMVEGAEGAGIGLGICVGIGIIIAPVLFALAAWIAAKV
jgi:hypothetical protein